MSKNDRDSSQEPRMAYERRDDQPDVRGARSMDTSTRAADKTDASSNPFVAFKAFVDDQFRVVLNIPANISELRGRMQEEKMARRRQELERHRRWTGREESADHLEMIVSRQKEDEVVAATEATVLLLRESARRNLDVPMDKIDALYDDSSPDSWERDPFADGPMLAFGGACYYRPETGDNLPSTASSMVGRPFKQSSVKWLSVDWFKESLYSPVNVEAHPLMAHDGDGSRWRAAFEDLLNASLDKQMSHNDIEGMRTPHGSPQSTLRGPGLDWMLSLHCRGVLPPQLPSLYNHHHRISMHDILRGFDTHDTKAFKHLGRYSSWFLEEDFQKLVQEVRTPPTAEEASTKQYASPMTELDMYEQLEQQQQQHDASFLTKDVADPSRHDEMSRRSIDCECGSDSCCPPKTVDRADEDSAWDRLVKSDSGVAELQKLFNEVDAGWNKSISVMQDVLETVQNTFDDMRSSERQDTRSTDEDMRDSWQRLMSLDQQERADLFRALVGDNNFDEAEATTTDEEYYDQHSDVEQHDNTQMRRSATSTPEPQPSVDHRPHVDVLSSLTTTQTTRLPDGTVTTKVVLKQRFADGREETHESVQTSRETAANHEMPSQAPPRMQDSGTQTDEQTSRGKGWFWR